MPRETEKQALVQAHLAEAGGDPEGWEAGRATGVWEKRGAGRGVGSVLLSSYYVRATDENFHVQPLPGTTGLDLPFSALTLQGCIDSPLKSEKSKA